MPSIDRISGLPENVQCHILSFLPTRRTVAISILSKRWTNVWRNVSTLVFTDFLYGPKAYFPFNEFVYSLLLSRNYIKSFTFRIRYDYPHVGHIPFPNFIKWINVVVQRGVEHLDISRTNVKPDLPISILSCSTLVVLKCYGFSVNVKGLSCITLPSLKILYLLDASITNARDITLLLAGCPILEDLYIWMIKVQSEYSLTYQECGSLDLRKLIIARMPGNWCHFPLKALHNVKQLQVEINKVYRPFDEIPTFHNLIKLKLHSINSNWSLFIQMLNHCPNIQNIELSQGTFVGEGLRDTVQENWVDTTFVPRCLSLQLKTCKLWYFRGQQDEFLLARYILKNARVLQTMAIGCHKSLKRERELYLCPRASPACQLTFNVNIPNN